MDRHFIVQLQNRPGELAHLARALGVRGVNISHIACAGAGPRSVAFITADDAATARGVLHSLEYDCIEGESIVVDIEDSPGGLADVTERLANAGVNILGTMSIGRRDALAFVATRRWGRARAVLGLAPVADGG